MPIRLTVSRPAPSCSVYGISHMSFGTIYRPRSGQTVEEDASAEFTIQAQYASSFCGGPSSAPSFLTSGTNRLPVEITLSVSVDGGDYEDVEGHDYCASIEASDFWSTTEVDFSFDGSITVRDNTPLGAYSASFPVLLGCS